MRSTRDRKCQKEFALLPECAGNTRSHVLEQETVLLRVRDETEQSRTSSEYVVEHEIARVRAESHFSEYAVRHEIARVRTQPVLLPEYADNTTCTCQGSTV